jgi:hypothetical protein
VCEEAERGGEAEHQGHSAGGVRVLPGLQWHE